MKKKILIGILIVVVAVSAVLIVNNQKPEALTVGVIASLSGDFGVVGEAFLSGVLLGQDEWNRNNPKNQIEIIVEDDEFQATKGLSAYHKLMSVNRVDALINMTTLTIDAIYGDVIQRGIPVAQGFEQGIPAADDNVVQLWPGNVPAEAELGAHIRSKGFMDVALVYENSSGFFTQAAGGFKKGYDDSLTEYKISNDPVDIRATAVKISQDKYDAIVLLVHPQTGAMLVREIQKLNTEPVQLVFDAVIQTGFETYKDLLGDTNFLNGSILFTVPNKYRDDFTIAYRQKFNKEPSVGAETGYNAFKLISTTYNKSLGRWVDNMKNASFIGSDGEVVFDENGVRIPRLQIGVIKDGLLPN